MIKLIALTIMVLAAPASAADHPDYDRQTQADEAARFRIDGTSNVIYGKTIRSCGPGCAEQGWSAYPQFDPQVPDRVRQEARRRAFDWRDYR